MPPNQNNCLICYNTFENYYCRLKCCRTDCCLACILRGLYSKFKCFFDNSEKIGFVIFNINNDHVLHQNDNMDSFTALKKNLMSNVNLTNQAYFYNIINNRPAWFIIYFVPDANITYDEAKTKLENYGSVEIFKQFEEKYHVHFYNITLQNSHLMISELNQYLFLPLIFHHFSLL